MSRKHIRIVSWGGLGDALLVTPSFRQLKVQYPGCRITVYCTATSHFEIYRHNPDIDVLKRLGPFAFASYLDWCLYRLGRRKFQAVNYGYLRPGLFYKKGAAEIIAEMLGVVPEDKKPVIFLTPAEEASAQTIVSQFRNPVAINPSALSSANKEWSLANWEAVIRQTPDVTFIQIGLQSEPLLAGAVDVRGRYSLRELMAVMKYVRGYVGLDSFWGHVAAAWQVPAVILFGPSNPAVWGHLRHTNLYAGLSCSPCIDILLNAPCPYGKKCMQAITVEAVRQALTEKLAVPAPVVV